MIASADALDSAATSFSVGNGLNQRSRTRPTFRPFARISRMATLIGSEMVPMPTRITSASSVMYSSNQGFSGPRPKTRRKSAYASSITVTARPIASCFWRRISMTQSSFAGDAIGDQRGVERFLRRVDPAEEPADVPDDERVVVLDAEGARIVERAVADEGDHGHSQRRRDDEAFHGVHPADAGRAAEDARAHGRRVLDDLELAVLAFGDDVLGHELAARDLLGDRLHDRVVRADRIRRDD